MEKKLTFTTEVKEEICSHEFTNKELLAILSGFCKVNGILTLSSNGMALNLKTENSKIAKMIYTTFKSLFDVTPNYTYSKKMKFDKGSVFHINIVEKTNEILETLELMKDGMPSYPQNIVKEEGLRYFIIGAFLASGSVNSPSSKNYHLQMVVFSEEDSKYFLKLLNRFRNEKSMDFKSISRRNRYVLYLKKGDQIATFLSIIYSHECLMNFENVRIEKDFINSDNRIQVCYTANYKKSLIKGEEQCKEINFLIEKNLLISLSDKVQMICHIRLENPDASLNQIKEILLETYNINLTKSGVNHIFNKVHEKYIEVKNDFRD